jgi:hypothetical protein
VSHVSQTARGRTSPLALRAGEHEVVLLPADVNALIDGMDRLVASVAQSAGGGRGASGVSLQAVENIGTLRTLLDSSTSRLTDPPVELDRDAARVLRQVMADLSGYQKSDLTRGLRDLAAAIERGFPA